MALMDAGIPLREHVAGISVGLVTEVDPSTNTIKDYRILTDILVRFLLDLLKLFPFCLMVVGILFFIHLPYFPIPIVCVGVRAGGHVCVCPY